MAPTCVHNEKSGIYFCFAFKEVGLSSKDEVVIRGFNLFIFHQSLEFQEVLNT